MHAAPSWTGGLAGEYARILIVGNAVLYSAFWLTHATHGLPSLLFALEGAALVGVALVRTRPLGGMLVTLVALAAHAAMISSAGWESVPGVAGIPPFLPHALTISWTLLLAFKAIDYWTSRNRSSRVVNTVGDPAGHLAGLRSSRWLVLGLVAVSASGVAGYMIVLPAVEMLFASDTRPAISTVSDKLDWSEQLRLRSAKLTVFAIFVYAGAALGSFLHVLSESMPQKRTVVFRSSACPVCQAPIRRRDNLPIFGYLWLRGRCRDCQTAIPRCYLAAEMWGATIFALFFLFELITGAANVPGAQHRVYTGIVWIILYAKWDVISLTAFHLFVFMTLTTAAFAVWHGLRMPRRFWITTLVIVGACVLAMPSLVPLKLTWLASLGISSSSFLALVTACFGALAGILVGEVQFWGAKQIWGGCEKASMPLERWPWVVLGAGLGWQAVLGTAVLYLVLLTTGLSTRLSRRIVQAYGPVWVLLIAAIIHHLLWQTLLTAARGYWPGPGTRVPAAIGLMLLVIFWGSLLAWKGPRVAVNTEMQESQTEPEVAGA